MKGDLKNIRFDMLAKDGVPCSFTTAGISVPNAREKLIEHLEFILQALRDNKEQNVWVQEQK